MEYTARPTAYVVEVHNGRAWVNYGYPYEEYLTQVIDEALDMGFPKVRYRTVSPNGKWRWNYAKTR